MSAFGYATNTVEFIKINPNLKVTVLKYYVPENDLGHIFTNDGDELVLTERHYQLPKSKNKFFKSIPKV